MPLAEIFDTVLTVSLLPHGNDSFDYLATFEPF